MSEIEKLATNLSINVKISIFMKFSLFNSKKKRKKSMDEKVQNQENQVVEETNNEKKDVDSQNVSDSFNANSSSQDSSSKQEKNDEIAELTAKLSEMTDKYFRLSAEYDNYRKRTLKERMELIKTAGEEILVNLLPIIDNFERALNSLQIAKDPDAIKQGIELIYNKFKEFLAQRGIRSIEISDANFNADFHEAITKIPAPKPELKNKIVDVVEKGYFLHDKVIRFAKVVVGE